MQHPAFQSPLRLLGFSGTCLLVGLAVFLCQYGLVPVSLGYLILDGLILGVIFGILSTFLWYAIIYAGLNGNNTIQKAINYTALVLLADILWLGSSYFFLYLCTPDEIITMITKSIPMKIILGILIYILTIRSFISISSKEDLSEEDPEEIKKPDSSKPGVEEVYLNPAPTERWLEKITVKTGLKIHVIAVTDIIFMQAEGDYVKIFTKSAHFIKEQTMKHFEENLPPAKFIRIHRSTIVNVDVISRIELYEKQYYRITLQSGHQLKASTSGYKLLKETLQL